MSQQVLSYFQVGIAVLLGAAILLQQKGQGLSGAFGGTGGFYRTKRGFEKILLISTIVLSAAFIATGIVRVVVAPSVTLPFDSLPPPPSEHTVLPGVDVNIDDSIVPLTVPDIDVKTEPVPQ